MKRILLCFFISFEFLSARDRVVRPQRERRHVPTPQIGVRGSLYFRTNRKYAFLFQPTPTEERGFLAEAERIVADSDFFAGDEFLQRNLQDHVDQFKYYLGKIQESQNAIGVLQKMQIPFYRFDLMMQKNKKLSLANANIAYCKQQIVFFLNLLRTSFKTLLMGKQNAEQLDERLDVPHREVLALLKRSYDEQHGRQLCEHGKGQCSDCQRRGVLPPEYRWKSPVARLSSDAEVDRRLVDERLAAPADPWRDGRLHQRPDYSALRGETPEQSRDRALRDLERDRDRIRRQMEREAARRRQVPSSYIGSRGGSSELIDSTDDDTDAPPVSARALRDARLAQQLSRAVR